METTRRHEKALLMIASLTLFAGIMSISLTTGTINSLFLCSISALCAGMLLVHFYFVQLRSNADQFILPIILILIAIGLTMLFRLRPDLFLSQILWLGFGLLAFVVAKAFTTRYLYKITQYKYLCGLLGALLLLAAILFGVEIGGHKSWIILGPIRFQPSEFAKLFIVLFLAAYLNEHKQMLAFSSNRYGKLLLPHWRYIAPLLCIWGLSMAMFILQRDLGSALLYFGSTILMVYMASGRFSFIIIGLVLFLAGSMVCYYLYSHVQVRVDIWLNPWNDPNGKAYQIVQSLFAIAAGGVFGTGLTFGFPEFIPEVHTDFIFSAVAEELGLLGAAAVIITYMLLVYRSFHIALTVRSTLPALIAAGIAAILALQVFLIIGGVTKFFPLTGITLPFISYGGSSIVSNFMLLGILFAISDVKTNDL